MRLSIGMLTRIPVGDVTAAASQPRLVGRAILLAPLVGLVLAVPTVILIDLLSSLLLEGAVGPASTLTALLIAASAIALTQWLTRGLHIDGLADTADSLAATGDAEQKREVMKRSDIGPMGVLVVSLTLMIQVVALAVAVTSDSGPYAIVSALVVGRVALIWAARLPPAGSSGLGHWVSGNVHTWAAIATTVGYAMLLGGLLTLGDDRLPADSLRLILIPLLLALVITQLLYARWGRTLGGITGDTLGAGVETATTVTLVAVALLA
jgi:adenosylcobinamide-GDP ribazoletransferase